MPIIIPANEIPDASYRPIRYKGAVAMLGVTQSGPVIMFTDIGETLFVPWDEVIEFAATSPDRKLPPDIEKAATTKKVREIHKPTEKPE